MGCKNFDYLIGQKSHLLTAIEIIKTPNRNYVGAFESRLKCICDCGKITYVYPYEFIKGSTKSCGCIKHNHPHNATHLESNTKLYYVWKNMRLKCKLPTHTKYSIYGARGIKVCVEWEDYLTFRKWALSHGYKEGLSIDRINNDGNYEPSNCRWTDKIHQARNKRNNRMITYNGKTQTLVEWCEELNLPYSTIDMRLQRGWPVERAFTYPISHSRKPILLNS